MARRIALIVAKRDGLVLFGKRSDNGRWTLPGGHVDADESPVDGARRELKEETGLSPVGELKLIDERELRDCRFYTYECVVDGVPNGKNDPDSECAVWAFFEVSDGIPKAVAENMAGPKDPDKNIAASVFGLAKADALAKAPIDGGLHNFDSGRAKIYIDQELRDGAKVQTHDLGILPSASRKIYNDTYQSPANGKNVYHHIISTPGSTQHTLSLSPDPSEHPLSYLNVEHYKGYGDGENQIPNSNWNGVPTTALSHTNSEATGMGLGTRLYQEALKHHGKLQSDASTSKGANALWSKLISSPGVRGRLGVPGDPASRHYAEHVGEEQPMIKHDTPEFRQWFNGSKVVDEHGAPLRVYHGTSKDRDFSTFKIGDRGAWFTADPALASGYAEANDSQGYKFDHATGEHVETNTASRVIPAHLSLKNPYKMTPEDHERRKSAPNYQRYQAQFHRDLKAKGHDGVDYGNGTYVAFYPGQIKGAFNTKPTAAKAFNKRVLDPNAGFTFSVEHNDNTYPPLVTVRAHHNGLPAGHVQIDKNKIGRKYMHSRETWVDPWHRRKGVASAMYAHAEKTLGRKMIPSTDRTWDGLSLWDGNKKQQQFGKSEGLMKTQAIDYSGHYPWSQQWPEGLSYPTPDEWLAGRHIYGTEKESQAHRMLHHPDPKQRERALHYPDVEMQAPTSPQFQRWFRDSQVVDHEGKPRVVFHGTRADFDTFDPAKLGSATGAASAHQGFFFSGRADTASDYTNMVHPHEKEEHDAAFYEARKLSSSVDRSHSRDPKRMAARSDKSKRADMLYDKARDIRTTGGNVMPVYLNLKNPYHHDMKGKPYRDNSYHDIIKDAKAKGHDGVIIHNTFDATLGDALPDNIHVAFHPHQIKSAIGNNGEYDGNSDRITKREQDDEIDRLLMHPNPSERSMALKLQGVQDKHLIRALSDEDPGIQKAALHHPNLTHDGLLSLMQMPNREHLQHLALQHPAINRAHIEALYHTHKNRPAHEKGEVMRAISHHPKLDSALIERMVDEGNGDHVVENLHTPPHVIERMIENHQLNPTDDKKRALARRALKHPHAPAHLVEHSFKNGPGDVKIAIAQGPHLPEALAQDVMQRGQMPDGDKEALLRSFIVQNPKASDRHLKTGLKDRNPIVRHLAGQKTGTFKDYQSEFNKFFGHAMAKAVRPEDFKGVKSGLDAAGAALVDHKPDLDAHPAQHAADVTAYKHTVLDNPDPVKRSSASTGTGGNVSRKTIYTVPGTHPTHAGIRYMVKPYHERISRSVASYQKHPHQGWAEMTNQALYHAGGIGHLHQNVHVAEHNMGEGHEAEPALVVKMNPNTQETYGIPPDLKREMAAPARQIAMMDFLSGNLDRHSGNLMAVRNDGGTGFTPLAIDHSRSFQYVNTNEFKRKPRREQPRELEDNFGNYVTDSALSSLAPVRAQRGADPHQWAEDWAPTFDWWGQNHENIKGAMNKRLEQIKDPEVRAHIKRNFDARTDYLDERSNIGIENYGDDWHQHGVPQYRPGEKTDAEREQERWKRENPEYA